VRSQGGGTSSMAQTGDVPALQAAPGHRLIGPAVQRRTRQDGRGRARRAADIVRRPRRAAASDWRRGLAAGQQDGIEAGQGQTPRTGRDGDAGA